MKLKINIVGIFQNGMADGKITGTAFSIYGKRKLKLSFNLMSKIIITVEKFLLSNFLWSHTPLFGHIL